MKPECGRSTSEISSIETGCIVDGDKANFKKLPSSEELLGRLSEDPAKTIERWEQSLKRK